MNDFLDNIFNQLEKWRDAKDLSQGEMAKELNITRETYNAWLSGRKKPSAESMEKIMEYLEG